MPLNHVFGALRDGYQMEVQRFFEALQAELGLGSAPSRRSPVGNLGQAVDRINERVAPWLTDLQARLQRDLARATRGILEEEGLSPGEAQSAVEAFVAQEWPSPAPWQLDPLRLPPTRAVTAALRRGSGAAVVLWLVAWIALPPALQNQGYLLSVLAGISLGLFTLQRVRAGEVRGHWEAIHRHLQGAGPQVAAAVEETVVRWVQTVQPWIRRGGWEDAPGTRQPEEG